MEDTHEVHGDWGDSGCIGAPNLSRLPDARHAPICGTAGCLVPSFHVPTLRKSLHPPHPLVPTPIPQHIMSLLTPAFRSLARSAPRHARALHASARASELSKFLMPAMSPTMTEGGIASWKKQEGDTFEAGDVLVEIETDKATIDVEAQDAGVLAKIIVGPLSSPLCWCRAAADGRSTTTGPRRSRWGNRSR